MALSGVPVQMFGMNVGSSLINDDGTFELNIDGPCQVGKNILQGLQDGQYSGFAIVPLPAEPRPVTGDGRPLSEFNGFQPGDTKGKAKKI